nr:TP53-target gene 5 protein [Meriones unguiculatus]
MTNQMQDEKLQDKKQPVSKLIERSRLRMVLKNLSLLKLLKSSNSRIQELHSLARRCWNSIIRIPKSPQISSGGNNVCKKVKQNNEELQEVRALGKRPEPKKAESVREPKGKTSNEWKPKKKPQGASTAVPQRKKQIKPKVLKMAKSHGLHTRAQKRKHHVKKPRVVFLKTYHHRTSPGDMKPLDTTDQLVWFEGLPTRVHLPGRRIMCRSSALRCIKRACTRFCCASL